MLCWDDMLDAVPGDERDGAAADRINHTGLIRTIAEISAHAVIISKSTNSPPFSFSTV